MNAQFSVALTLLEHNRSCFELHSEKKVKMRRWRHSQRLTWSKESSLFCLLSWQQGKHEKFYLLLKCLSDCLNVRQTASHKMKHWNMIILLDWSFLENSVLKYLSQLKFYLDILQVTVTCCKGNQWVPYLCLRFRAQTELFVKLISHSLLLVLQNSTGHPHLSSHLCQPLGTVSETLGDEKNFLVMMVRWLPSPGCKTGIHTAHCPGSFYQQDRFFSEALFIDRNLPDAVFCTLCIHGTCEGHFFSSI